MTQRGEQALPTRRERLQLNRNLKTAALSGDSIAALALAALQLSEVLARPNRIAMANQETVANARG